MVSDEAQHFIWEQAGCELSLPLPTPGQPHPADTVTDWKSKAGSREERQKLINFSALVSSSQRWRRASSGKGKWWSRWIEYSLGQVVLAIGGSASCLPPEGTRNSFLSLGKSPGCSDMLKVPNKKSFRASFRAAGQLQGISQALCRKALGEARL